MSLYHACLLPGSTQLKIGKNSIGIRAWISNYILVTQWDAIIHPCPNFNCGLVKSSQKLTHWGRVTHICVSQLTIICSDNGLSPDRRQAIIWTNAGILLIGLLGTSFSEILIEILTFSFKKLRLKVSSAKRRPFCLGLNVLSMSKQLHPT